MMDWTDRHCRFLLRQISRYTRLYTEVATAPTLMHGDLPPVTSTSIGRSIRSRCS